MTLHDRNCEQEENRSTEGFVTPQILSSPLTMDVKGLYLFPSDLGRVRVGLTCSGTFHTLFHGLSRQFPGLISGTLRALSLLTRHLKVKPDERDKLQIQNALTVAGHN